MAGAGHIAIRTCVVCGQKSPKADLLRLALDADRRSVVLDSPQRKPGRGAYLCAACLPRLRFTKRVQKAFRRQAQGLAQELLEQSPACGDDTRSKRNG